MPDQIELELLRQYRLSPERVDFLRARLENVEPYPKKELNRKRRRLLALYRKIGALCDETRQIRDEVEPRGIHCPWWEGGSFHYSGPFDLEWDLLEQKWGEGLECDDVFQGFSGYLRITTKYAQRPDQDPPRRIWNAFAIAAINPPDGMIRAWGKGFHAAFRDAQGRIVTVSYDFIQQKITAVNVA